MFQKPSKTLFYMKIMVCKIPPGGAKPFLASGLRAREDIIWFSHVAALMLTSGRMP